MKNSTVDAYSTEDIQAPNWALWSARKFCQVQHAVMLSLNLDPTKRCRKALALYAPERHQEYLDRLSIAKARAGHDLPLHENYFQDDLWGDDKVVLLPEFLVFAEGLGWAELAALREALAPL